MMWLPSDIFRTVVSSAPLVSIDLIVQNADGRVLLGQRLNRPAKGFWFVPGGRIQKNETLDTAFARLTEVELGQRFERGQCRLLDVYEHFYTDSVFGGGTDGPDTHYVVLGYHLCLLPGVDLQPPVEQHGCYRWWSPQEMLDHPDVHKNTRAYLKALR